VGIAERISVLGGRVSYGVTPDRRWMIDATMPWSVDVHEGAIPVVHHA
jgi:hypothetical protein